MNPEDEKDQMEYETKLPTHPGHVLEDFMTRFHVSPYDLHAETDLTMELIEDIMAGEEDLTHDSSFLFGQVFSTGTDFWLNLQKQYNKKCMDI